MKSMTEVELRQLVDTFRNQSAETECVEFKEAKTTYDFGKIGKSSLHYQTKLI